MLYTVSAIQILATIDALGELDIRGKAGMEKVGKCIRFRSTCSNNTKASMQILQNCKTARLGPSQEMNGGKQTHGFSSVLSLHYHSCTSCTL